MSVVPRWTLSLLAVALLVTPARAQTLAEKVEDARIAARAEVRLAQDETLRAFIFHPTSEAGVLTIVGVVKTQAQRDRVGEVVGGVEGVTQIVNNVQVTGTAGLEMAIPDTTDGSTPEGPSAPTPEPAVEEVYHTVRSGDTLSAIARQHGVSVRQVQQLNGLRGSRIRAGQRLRVK